MSNHNMKYSRLKKADLVKFAADRQLTVKSSKPGKDPHYRDYAKALEAADRDATFRFLHLPPELRTWVYNALLILDNSFTSSPQILRTCKQIKNEATNTLYGHNLIDIQIRPNGVYAHGEICGEYEPAEAKSLCRTDLRWPDFLRRAQFIRISVSSASWPNRHTIPPSVLPDLCMRIDVGSIIHSFCKHLTNAHRLRNIQFDLNSIRCTDNQAHEIIYAVRLLGRSPEVSLLRGEAWTSVDVFDIPSMDLRNGFLESDTWTKLQIVRKCYSLLDRLYSIYFGSGVVEQIASALGKVVLTIAALAVGTLHHRGYLGGVFVSAVSVLRMELEMCALFFQEEDLLLQLYEMFRLEIDLRSLDVVN